MADKVTEREIGAELEPWARLAAGAGQLHVLYQQGHLEEVVEAVTECHATMSALPGPVDGDTPPWSIRGPFSASASSPPTIWACGRRRWSSTPLSASHRRLAVPRNQRGP